MPQFSCFTPFGMLAFSSAPSEAQKYYDLLSNQYSTAFDITPGEPDSEDAEAEVYALAMHLARIKLTLQRAGDQRNVANAVDMLPNRELDFLAIPKATDTILQRQQRLSAIRALSLGASQSNIAGVLASVLGPAFVKLRVVAQSEVATDLPTSNFATPGLPPVVAQLTSPVTQTGVAYWVNYTGIDPTAPAAQLIEGTSVTVQGENNAQAEVVEVSGTQLASDGVTTQFEATFTNAHDVGATVNTGPFCRWTSNKAFLFVELTPAAAVDAPTRAVVDAYMQKLARGVTGWANVAASGGVIGPYVVGTTPLGTATIAGSPA
jgi:hypothetical protein